MNSPIPQSIFESITHAGVVQDKATPQRTYKASGQLSYDSPPANSRPKHHGSQKRQLRQVSGCITNDAFQRLEVMRNAGKKNEMSRSSVVGKFVTQGIQQNADMQYISMLEPVIKNEIKKDIGSYSNRIAFLAAQSYYSAEESRIINTKVLSYLFGSDTEIFKQLVAEARKEARASLNRHMTEKDL